MVADSDRVVQVVINLISNAVTDSGQITVQVAQEWSSLTISVADQGTGISEADQSWSLKNASRSGRCHYRQTHRNRIGFAHFKRNCGDAWRKNMGRKHHRERFNILLQLAFGDRRRHRNQSIDIQDIIQQLGQNHTQPKRETAQILVIDDDPAIREMLVQLLDEAGHQTLEATDGVEGLEAARQEQPDAIILDVMMPRLNGFDCAAAIKGTQIADTFPS